MEPRIFLIFFTCLAASIVGRVYSDEVGYYAAGDEANELRDFRYHVLVKLEGGKSSCSGGILDDTHVVTAASCVAYRSGSLFNLPINVVTAGQEVSVEVERAYVPRSYLSVDSAGADVSVLKLKKPLEIEANKLEKLELPQTWGDPVGDNVTVSGYNWNWLKVTRNSTTGKLIRTAGTFDKLRYAKLKVLSRQGCNSVHPNLPQNLLCASKPLDKNLKSTHGICTGDLGGPVVDSKKTLFGIVSYSPFGCSLESKGLGVYTNVLFYKNFIKKALTDEPDYDSLTLQLPSAA